MKREYRRHKVQVLLESLYRKATLHNMFWVTLFYLSLPLLQSKKKNPKTYSNDMLCESTKMIASVHKSHRIIGSTSYITPTRKAISMNQEQKHDLLFNSDKGRNLE